MIPSQPPGERARSTDPATSHAAAAGDRSTHLRAILEAYVTAPPSGLTDEEAARATGIDRVATTRRASELRNLGLIKADGSTRKLSTGRSGMVCHATPEGAAAHAGEAPPSTTLF